MPSAAVVVILVVLIFSSTMISSRSFCLKPMGRLFDVNHHSTRTVIFRRVFGAYLSTNTPGNPEDTTVKVESRSRHKDFTAALAEADFIKIPRSFPLTIEEQTLFTALRSVVVKYNLSTTVRVAGGWVRDKVINKYIKIQ